MRILMLTNRSGVDARGGAERVVVVLAEALRARGHEVTVRARTTVGFRSLHRMPVGLRALWHCCDLLNIASAWSLYRFLRHLQSPISNLQPPHIVHTHNLVGCGGLTPWVIRRYCRRTGARWVHTLHDVQLITPSGLLMYRSDVGAASRGRPRERELGSRMDPQPQTRAGTLPRPYADGVPQSSLERSVVARWFRAMRRRMFGSPHAVISPSRWLLQLHRGERFFPASRDVVIGNPVGITDDADAHADDADMRIPLRSAYPHHLHQVSASSVIPGEHGAIRSLLFVGQLEGHKGILVLLEAYTQLRELFPDIALHVVGDGSLLPLLKRVSRDVRNLAVRGRLDADGVATAIAHADLVVVPSLCAENQPTVILEAFAAGVPVVASRVGGIPELVADGETGFIVDPGSVEDLARVLRACIEDPRRVRAMGTACRERAAAHDPLEVAQSYEEVYTYGAPR